MIEKKSFMMTLKRALQQGTFNFVGQQATEFPKDLFRIDSLQFDDQNWWDCVAITKMDFSNNSIEVIPQEIMKFEDLQLLRMKNNKVEKIPQCLASFPNLKSLDLSKNRINQMSQQLSKFPALVELNLSENALERLPNLSFISTLELVYLNDNKLKELPQFGPGIKRIEASSNQIKFIRKESFCRCKLMEILNLGRNLIEKIEEGSFIFSQNLISIELKQNKLEHFTEVPQSMKLDTINVAFNRLTEYTIFDKSPNLTVLILADNKIKVLSSKIIRLTKLKTLDISNNDLSDLPCEIGFISSLVRIQVEGNPLKCIRQNIRTGGTGVLKKYLQDKMDPNEKQKIQNRQANSFEVVKENQYWGKLINEFNQNGQLFLRKLDLKFIDEIVFEKNLKTLNISDNKVKQLSENISKLDGLKTLIINNNLFESLPCSLGLIRSLQIVQAKNNQISFFGDRNNHINNVFANLNYLDLSANKFKEISKPIILIKKLRTLQMPYNQLSSVDCLWQKGCLPKIQTIDVSNNKIDQISDDVYCKATLLYFNIENNNLSKLPTVLGFMKLSGLKVDGNPLKLIKRQVIEKGTVALMDFLRTKHVGDPPAPIQLIKEEIPKHVPQKPNYPYETQPKYAKKQEKMDIEYPQINREDNSKRIYELESEIKRIQKELDANMGMNNIQKMEKKKRMQALMIERNRLMK